MSEKYNVESYWSSVARRLKSRDANQIIAGDNEPFYIYKRKKFVELLSGVDFKNKSVLEIGSGPGGNLMEVLKLKPKKLVGADISQDMIDIAKERCPMQVSLVKVDGTSLPFESGTFDIVFTATVLQHNTDEQSLINLINEICRVSDKNVYLFERIEDTIKGDDLNLGRPISYYSALMEKNGFKLTHQKFLPVTVSYYLGGITRKLLNRKDRAEGEPLSSFSILVQKIFLPVTKILDKFIVLKRELAMLEYTKI